MQTIDTSRFPKQANITTWSKITGLSRGTINNAIAAGQLKGYRHINGRDRMFTRESIIHWLQTRKKLFNWD
jgi:predicted DNA-binding transcriptional regulator AlpA